MLRPMSTVGTTEPLPGAKPDTPVRRRPGWLTFFLIAAIAVAVMKLWSSISMMSTSRLLQFQREMIENRDTTVPSNPVSEMQAEIYRRISEVTGQFAQDHAVLILVGMVACILVIVGAIGSFKLRPRFRIVLLGGLVALLGSDLLIASAELNVQLEISKASEGMMRKMAELTGQENNGVLNAMSGFYEFVQAMSRIMAMAMQAVRLILVLGAAVYVARRSTAQLFDDAEQSRRLGV